MADDSRRRRAGLLLGLGAYLLWGVLPLYFKALVRVDPTEIVAHRIVWSLLFLAGLATLWRRWGAIRAAVTTPRLLATLAVFTFLASWNDFMMPSLIIAEQSVKVATRLWTFDAPAARADESAGVGKAAGMV